MIHIGSRKIGEGQPCFITFEAGATHDGLDSAMELVRQAARAGADAVKFQVFDPDRLVSDKKFLFSYDILADRETGRTETVTEPLYDILKRRYLNPEEWRNVKSLSDELGLAFFATACFEEDIALLESLGCDSIKISSADIDHWPLIRQAARTGMCIQLDTGNAAIEEVQAAVDVCRQEGNGRVIIHNCPSGYPARLDSIHLNMITTLKQMFPDCAVAFSDHTPGWDMDVAAVALGVRLVEKTVTLDRTIRSAEHLFSLEPDRMAAFVRVVRDVETAMGSHLRELPPAELEKRKGVRRSTFTAADVKKGAMLTLEQVEFRRPGFGISPRDFECLIGKQIRHDLPRGHMLAASDVEDR